MKRALLLFLIGTCFALSTAVCHGALPSVAVDATVLSKNKCTFNSNAATLAFSPNLNPVNPTVRTATTTLVGAFVCRGSSQVASYTITANSGVHGSNRLEHVSNSGQHIPYTFSYSPTTGSAAKNANQDLVLTVTIQPSDYQDVIEGQYEDVVTLTISP